MSKFHAHLHTGVLVSLDCHRHAILPTGRVCAAITRGRYGDEPTAPFTHTSAYSCLLLTQNLPLAKVQLSSPQPVD